MRASRPAGRLAMAVATAVLALLAAGCGAAAPPAAGGYVVPPPTATTATAPEPETAKPVALDIPAIGAASSLIETGLRPDGSLEVPDVDTPEQASWWSGSPAPGEVGPAVLLGHVDGAGRPGVFARLAELRAGDLITVTRVDAVPVTFVVDRVQLIAKAKFPTAEVYGDVDQPELRVLTCGGEFDRATGHYRDQVIVYALPGDPAQP